MSYDVYSRFDLKEHNKFFINYCEVIIDKDGVVHYATPSHQLMLLAMYGQKIGVLEDVYTKPHNVMLRHGVIRKMMEYIPTDVMFDVNDWLAKQLECIIVYTNVYHGTPNKKQLKVLKMLHRSGACKFKSME